MNSADIDRILNDARSIAVVGYSANPQRPSHWISNYLEEQGYQILRVNPSLESTSAVPIHASIEDLPQTVDIVDVFRAPPHLPAVVEAAIANGARVVWMQPGAENPEAAASARSAGLEVVVGRCIYAEHSRGD